MTNALELYRRHYVSKDDERLGLFIKLAEKYEIENVLYAGSFVHITPSLVFPRVVYVESDRRAPGFFRDQVVHDYVNAHKRYYGETQMVFHKSDYTRNFGEDESSFDLLISQSAGFISSACKKYLKVNGLLLANNSHGDASMASIDNDYELVAVYHRRKDAYIISERDLKAYFIPKSGIEVTRLHLERTQRGVGYTRTASGYVFRRVR